MATSTTRTLVELVSRSCKTKKLFLFGNETRNNLLVHSFNYNLQNKALISVSQGNRRKMADEVSHLELGVGYKSEVSGNPRCNSLNERGIFPEHFGTNFIAIGQKLSLRTLKTTRRLVKMINY